MGLTHLIVGDFPKAGCFIINTYRGISYYNGEEKEKECKQFPDLEDSR